MVSPRRSSGRRIDHAVSVRGGGESFQVAYQEGFMRDFSSLCAVTALLCAAAALGAETPTRGVPDFSANDVSWEGVGMEFMPPPSGPGPVVSDKAHPYISNQVFLAT